MVEPLQGVEGALQASSQVSRRAHAIEDQTIRGLMLARIVPVGSWIERQGRDSATV